jgi:hypothetical protein
MNVFILNGRVLRRETIWALKKLTKTGKPRQVGMNFEWTTALVPDHHVSSVRASSTTQMLALTSSCG